VTGSPAALKVTCLIAGGPLSRTSSSRPRRWTTPPRDRVSGQGVAGERRLVYDHHVVPETSEHMAVADPATRPLTITMS